MGRSFSRRGIVTAGAAGLAGAALPLMTEGTAAARPAVPPVGTFGPSRVFDVRRFGAKGDGVTIDSPAINRAIDAAAKADHRDGGPGGTVYLPAGTYASYSIRLKSNVALYIGQGATLLAAA